MTTTLINKIDAAVEEANKNDGNRWHLGASEIGKECARALWYKFRWAKRPAFSGRMYRLFDRGHREEDALAFFLRQAGVMIKTVTALGDQKRISALGGHFGGSLDGAMTGIPGHEGEWMVAEFKTHSNKSFTKLVKERVRRAKPEHYAQMQIYMHMTGLKKAGYLSVNKDNDELYFEVIEHSESFCDGLMEKAARIIEADVPPDRIAGPDFYICRWCDFKDICHGQDLPERNCRTCIHSTPITDGTDGEWHCAEENDMGSTREALPCHRLNPHMFNTKTHGVKNGNIEHGLWTDAGPGSHPSEALPLRPEAPSVS